MQNIDREYLELEIKAEFFMSFQEIRRMDPLLPSIDAEIHALVLEQKFVLHQS